MEILRGKLTYSLKDIENICPQFFDLVHPLRIIGFNGEMGAGKTTLISALCNYLQAEDKPSSPTFSLINEYSFQEKGKQNSIFHIDLYRLKSLNEMIHAGIEDCILNAHKNNCFAFVEWSQLGETLMPRPYIHINIESKSEYEREVSIWEVGN